MDTRDFLVVRRAFNLVRNESPRSLRLTFEEFAMMCHLLLKRRPVGLSEIAREQNVQRPTLTRRANRLEGMELTVRMVSDADKRAIFCSPTIKGKKVMQSLAGKMQENIVDGACEGIAKRQLYSIVSIMSSMSCTAADLVLMSLLQEEANAMRVTRIVELTGLLQPTISMAVSLLEQSEYLRRGTEEDENVSPRMVLFTDEGKKRADGLVARVAALDVEAYLPRTK